MIHNMKKWVATFLLATTVALPSVSYATNAISEIGVGAKSKGMGGVGVALPQDAFAAGMNPAGIAYQGNRLDVGFGWLWQNGRTDIRAGNTNLASFKTNQGLWLPEAAISWEFCPCQVVGIAAFVSAGAFTKYNPGALGAQFDLTSPAGLFYYNLFVTPSWAWRVNSVHSVGVAMNISFDWVNVKGVQGVITPSDHPNDVSNRGNNTAEGASIHIGWMGQFCDIFRVGASFQTQTWSDRHKKYQGLFVNEGFINLPPQVGLGVAWTCMPCITIAADFVYRIWQASRQFDNTSRQSGVIFDQFGSSSGPGFGWRNQPIAKVGVAWDVWPCLTLRAGYNYGETPITPSETPLNAFTLCPQEHHVTAGATFKWCRSELTGFYYHAFQKRVNGFGSTGTSGVEVNLRNQQNVAGVSYGMWF